MPSHKINFINVTRFYASVEHRAVRKTVMEGPKTEICNFTYVAPEAYLQKLVFTVPKLWIQFMVRTW